MSALAQVFPVVINDFSGGQVDGEHVTQLALNQFEDMRNGYAVGKRFRGRPGVKKISTTGAYSENLNSFRTYRPVGSNWNRGQANIVVGHQTGFAYLNGTTLTTISTALPSNSEPWHMRQFNDVMYAARTETTLSDSVLRRVLLSGVSTAGIAAPATAPSAAQGGAGPLEAGDYTYVVTFRNSTTGAESNPSDSVTVTVVANKAVDLSSIPVSANAQVNQRRIYRSIIGSTGAYYLVGSINDNVTTTYTDTVDEDDLGDRASNDNAPPTTGIIGIEAHLERLWAWSETEVRYSRSLFPESWPETQVIPVGNGALDEETIRQCLADGCARRLLIGRTRSIYEITGSSEKNFELRLVTSAHGVAGPHCMTTVEGLVFFYSGDNIFALQQGGRDPVNITTPAVRKIMDAIPAAQRKKVRLSFFAEQSWLIVLCPYDTTTAHKLMLAYNYKTGAWAVNDFAAFGAQAPCFVGEAMDAGFTTGLYAVVDHSSYRYLYRFTDDVFTDGEGTSDGSAITVQLRTFGVSAQGRKVFLRRVGLLGRFIRNDPSLTTYNVNVYAYVEGTIYNVVAKVAAFLAPTNANRPQAAAVAQWTQTNLSTAQKPGTFVQVLVTCTETENRVELEAISLDARVSERRRKAA